MQPPEVRKSWKRRENTVPSPSSPSAAAGAAVVSASAEPSAKAAAAGRFMGVFFSWHFFPDPVAFAFAVAFAFTLAFAFVFGSASTAALLGLGFFKADFLTDFGAGLVGCVSCQNPKHKQQGID
jgi:hypothetical protein